MPDHLSSIGFRVESQDDFVQLARTVFHDAEPIPVPNGHYLCWTGAGGEQLWLQLNPQGEFIGMHPHFDGRARLRARLETRIGRDNHTVLDGAFHAWASPDDMTPGAYPFVFDAPDAARYADIEIPGIAEAQVTAFAHELALFDSEDAYSASQGDGLQLASRSFIPSGMFRPDGHEDTPPAALAIFTGQILQAEIRTNTVSGMQFWWGLVDTFGGRYDVVADPVLLDRQPVVGGFLSGTFWLSGRLVTDPRSRKSWFDQLRRANLPHVR